jgi:hypothetical protein
MPNGVRVPFPDPITSIQLPSFVHNRLRMNRIAREQISASDCARTRISRFSDLNELPGVNPDQHSPRFGTVLTLQSKVGNGREGINSDGD